jgi:predicted tellurium resistance membrane protein TerC
MNFQELLTADGIVSLITLTFLEIVLGIDNIIFISIAANKLARTEQSKARNIGLLLAMFFRIILLFGISFIISLQQPFTHIRLGWLNADMSGQSLVLFVGGLFLLYKATSEIHEKLEGGLHEAKPKTSAAVIFSVLIMMAFGGLVGDFVNRHPSIQMLGMAFLIMIGFMLIAESAHDSNVSILGSHVGSVPKGYLYFAIAFSLLVEVLNIKMRKVTED